MLAKIQKYQFTEKNTYVHEEINKGEINTLYNINSQKRSFDIMKA